MAAIRLASDSLGLAAVARSEREKGARRERQIAEILGATKISMAWQPGPDLEWLGRMVEVKARRDGWKQLYRWLEDAQILALKADRKEWLIVLRADELLDLIEEADPPEPPEVIAYPI
jgi:hypothetical protein